MAASTYFERHVVSLNDSRTLFLPIDRNVSRGYIRTFQQHISTGVSEVFEAQC
jgi:hypothetical protein